MKDKPLGACRWWFGLLVFCFLLLIYGFYLCPTIAAGDSGELVNCAYTLGIPHPPGYPLYTMLAHLFTRLPWHSVAWRVNLFSAFATAGAAAMLYLCMLRLTRRVVPALASALVWGLSRIVWHYAEVAEVFPLNSLLAAGISYFVLCLPPRPTVRQQYHALVPGAILTGLALSNHHTAVLLGPAILVAVAVKCPEAYKNPKLVATVVGTFILGLLPYIYLPLAARMGPAINWGDPVTWGRFFQLVTRSDYGTLSLLPQESSLATGIARWQQVPGFVAGMHYQFSVIGLILAILGLWRTRQHKATAGYLLLAFVFSGVFFAVFANYPIDRPLLLGVLHRFYMMPSIFVAFWIGYGVLQIVEWLERTGGRAWATGMATVIVVAYTGLLFAQNREEADFRNNYIAEDHARNIMLPLPQGALLFLRGDVPSMGVDYLQHVVGHRTDVIALDQEKLTYPWYYEQVKKRYPQLNLPGERYDGSSVFNVHLIEANSKHRSVFFLGVKEESYKLAFYPARVGHTHLMISHDESVPQETVIRTHGAVVRRFRLRGFDKAYPSTSFEHEIKGYYRDLPGSDRSSWE